MTLALRCAIAVTALFSFGCGLIPADPIDFQIYPLRDTTYQEAERVVRDVTRALFTTGFGGVTIEWVEETRNLRVSPIVDEAGRRRMTVYINLVPVENGADVEILALVEHLILNGDGVGWAHPLMDKKIERILHQAFIDEIVRRRIKANASP